MSSLTIPIDEALLAQLRERAVRHNRNVETEAQILLMQSMQVQPQPVKKTPLDFAGCWADWQDVDDFIAENQDRRSIIIPQS